MVRAFLYTFVGYIFLSSSAYACSCFCSYDQTVSEFLDDRDVLWGVPIQSSWVRGVNQTNQRMYDKVTTQVQIIEGYGQVENKSELIVSSSPDDGASCGLQLNVGVPQMITTFDKDNYVSNCSCEPPLASLLKYFKEGKDTFIPNPQDCEKPAPSSDMMKKCEVWESEWTIEIDERRRIYDIFREREAE